MLKKILTALAAIVVIFVIVVALQPADFRVERTTTIAAPQAELFAQVTTSNWVWLLIGNETIRNFSLQSLRSLYFGPKAISLPNPN
jgi:hypothetical protein